MSAGRATPLLLVLSGLGFAALGLPDGLLGVAWPSMRTSFALPVDAVGMLLVSSTAGYVASSFASGAVLSRMTIGTLLAASCLTTAASLLGYAAAPLWVAVVLLGCIAGLGAGAIDAGINTYAATHHSARVLSLLHAFYGLGTATGPVIMTGVLMAGSPWQRGYVIVGVAQLALAACFGATTRQWPKADAVGDQQPAPAIIATLRLPACRLGIATFFLYVGLEAVAGVWIFSLLHGGRGLAMGVAGGAVSVYWGALMVGRLLFALTPYAASPGLVLRACTGAVAAAAALLACDAGPAPDLVAVALLGVAAGPIFPALVATTPARLGDLHTANAVGFQVAAAALGQSLLPTLVGVLASTRTIEMVATALAVLAAVLWVVYRGLDRAAPIPAPARPA